MQIKNIISSSLLVLATCSQVYGRNIPKPLPNDFQLEQRATHTEHAVDIPVIDTAPKDIVDIITRPAEITTADTIDLPEEDVDDAEEETDAELDDVDESHVLKARLVKTAPGQSPVGIDNGIPSLLALSGIIIGVYGMLIFVSWDEVN